MTIIQLGLREKILLALRKDSNLLTTTDWNLIFFTEDIKQNELFISYHARRTHISKISCYIKWLSHNAFKVFEFLWELSKVLVRVEEVLITENWINMPSKNLSLWIESFSWNESLLRLWLQLHFFYSMEKTADFNP